jgi:glycosyltransferase involved in cell wall biosynthesis
VLHVISGLGVGGAEHFLIRLSNQLKWSHDFDQLVVSIDSRQNAHVSHRLNGIDVIYLNSDKFLQLPLAWRKLRRIIKGFAPDIVQSWLYRGDFLAALACLGRTSPALVWNLRCADAILPLQSRALTKLCAWLSYSAPHKIIACGQRAMQFHAAKGYDLSRMTVINNGYNFSPMPSAEPAHAPHPVNGGRIVIGAIGRSDPSKDYHNLLSALALVVRTGRDVELKIAGRGCSNDDQQFGKLIDQMDLRAVVYLLGEIEDVDTFYQSLDIYCLSSRSEGFPNTVCEAMGHGIPPVVTDAGDAAQIVGDTGLVVPVSDPAALAAALIYLIDLPADQRRKIGHSAALAVRSRYDIGLISENYDKIYEALVK